MTAYSSATILLVIALVVGANVAILGAMMAKCHVVDTDKMVEAIREELGERKAKFLEGNKKALLAGKEMAEEKWKYL